MPRESIFTIKLSICAFYLRIFTEDSDRIYVWANVAYNVVVTIFVIFDLIFRCVPLEGIQPYSSTSWSIIELKIKGLGNQHQRSVEATFLLYMHGPFLI